ncbi:unnamed protein product [Polarella glacialis]|uniref:Ubiquitin-like domain-containing protein n=1 Tax=Polarella glacialis TaxID=89957 RepID=A0A813L3E3_POLGL|nr:unnamed protein product [Polarella glacialis]CAE8726195.1 unnamed protein product [Polarella glacialis]
MQTSHPPRPLTSAQLVRQKIPSALTTSLVNWSCFMLIFVLVYTQGLTSSTLTLTAVFGATSKVHQLLPVAPFEHFLSKHRTHITDRLFHFEAAVLSEDDDVLNVKDMRLLLPQGLQDDSLIVDSDKKEEFLVVLVRDAGGTEKRFSISSKMLLDFLVTSYCDMENVEDFDFDFAVNNFTFSLSGGWTPEALGLQSGDVIHCIARDGEGSSENGEQELYM